MDVQPLCSSLLPLRPPSPLKPPTELAFLQIGCNWLAGSTPGSSISSSIFNGRHTSPAAGLLPCPGITSASPSLLNKLSENQVASRPLAPASSSLSKQWGESSGKVSQPLTRPAGQSVYCRQHWSHSGQSLAKAGGMPNHQPGPGIPPKADNCIDWSSYMNDETTGDVSDISDMPETNLSAYTGPFSMLDGSQHRTKHAQHVQSAHKLTRSPLEANLQPLKPSRVYGQATRSLEQQQPSCHPKQSAQQQTRQALQHTQLQQEQTQMERLPSKQAHNSTTSRISMTGSGTKMFGLVPDADLLHCPAPCRGGSSKLERTNLLADKKNTLAGRKPVQKSLFGEQGQLIAESQAPAPAWASEPACLPADSTVGSLNAVEHDSSAATAGGQQCDQPESTGQEPVDFSSVFDFL